MYIKFCRRHKYYPWAVDVSLRKKIHENQLQRVVAGDNTLPFMYIRSYRLEIGHEYSVCVFDVGLGKIRKSQLQREVGGALKIKLYITINRVWLSVLI